MRNFPDFGDVNSVLRLKAHSNRFIHAGNEMLFWEPICVILQPTKH